MIKNTTRRRALATIAMSLTAGARTNASGITRADTVDPTILPAGASTLSEFTRKLAKAARRRDFKSGPMILAPG